MQRRQWAGAGYPWRIERLGQSAPFFWALVNAETGAQEGWHNNGLRAYPPDYMFGQRDRANRDALSQRYLEKHYDNPIRSERVIAPVTPDRQRSAPL